MSPPRLPPELIDDIIAHVVDKPALLACALVSRNWLPASRCQILARVYIASKRAYRSFVDNLLLSSSLQPYLVSTKSLVLEDPSKDDKGQPQGPVSERDPQSWTYRFVHEFAGHLPKLEVLEIWGADWIIRPPHPRINLVMSRFSSLRELVLWTCNLPSSQMLRRMVSALSTSLLVLDLHGTKWPSAHHDHLSAYIARTPGPALTRLRISSPDEDSDSVAAFLRWLSFTPTQRSLRYFDLRSGAVLWIATI